MDFQRSLVSFQTVPDSLCTTRVYKLTVTQEVRHAAGNLTPCPADVLPTEHQCERGEIPAPASCDHELGLARLRHAKKLAGTTEPRVGNSPDSSTRTSKSSPAKSAASSPGLRKDTRQQRERRKRFCKRHPKLYMAKTVERHMIFAEMTGGQDNLKIFRVLYKKSHSRCFACDGTLATLYSNVEQITKCRNAPNART